MPAAGSRRRRTATGALLALVLTTAGCSAGRPAGPAPGSTAAAALAAAHGSVAEVLLALREQGLPCLDEVRLPPSDEAEELSACRIGDERVLVAHFLDVRQAERFARAVEQRGEHGAFADTWALRSTSPDLARRVADALAAPRRR